MATEAMQSALVGATQNKPTQVEAKASKTGALAGQMEAVGAEQAPDVSTAPAPTQAPTQAPVQTPVTEVPTAQEPQAPAQVQSTAPQAPVVQQQTPTKPVEEIGPDPEAPVDQKKIGEAVTVNEKEKLEEESLRIKNEQEKTKIGIAVSSEQEKKTMLDKQNKMQMLALKMDSVSSSAIAELSAKGKIGLDVMEAIKTHNPQKYAEILQEGKKQNDLAVVNKEDDAEQGFLQQYNDVLKTQFKEMTGDEPNLVEQYKSMVDSDEILQVRKEYNSLDRDRKDLKDQIDNIEDDVRAELGEGATESLIRAVASKRSKALTKDYNSLLNEMGEVRGNLTAMTDKAQQEFGLVKEQFQQQDARQRRNLQFQYNVTKDVFDKQWKQMETQTAREFQTSQIASDRDYKMKMQDYTRKMDMADRIQLAQMEDGQRRGYLEYQMALQDKYKDDKLMSFKDSSGNNVIYNATQGKYDVYEPGKIIPEQVADGIIGFARNLESKGVKYKMGAKVPGTGLVDCSGLVTSFGVDAGVISPAEGKFGINAQSMFNESVQEGIVKPLDGTEKGDLIYRKDPKGRVTHVSVVDGGMDENGNLSIIDSSVAGGGVKSRTINVKDGKYGKYQLSGAGNFLRNRLEKSQKTVEAQDLPSVNVADLSAKERDSIGFADRMGKDLAIFDDLEDHIKSLSSADFMAQRKMPNWMPTKSEKMQQLQQAERDFVNAVLRQESGAAISPEEFSSAEKQYFPQPGDSESVIDQKRNNRKTVLDSMVFKGGVQKLSQAGFQDYKRTVKNEVSVDQAIADLALQQGGFDYLPSK